METQYTHINELGQLNSKSKKEAVVNAFRNIKSFYKNSHSIPAESYVFRARLGSSVLQPERYLDLSYNPNFDMIKIGRANPDKIPIFYGTTHPNFNKIDQTTAIKVAIMECSQLLRENNNENGIELGCVSRWRLTRELKLFSFFNYDFGVLTDPMIIDFNKQLNDQIMLNSGQPARDLEINRWIATIFAERFNSEDAHKYQISSMLANNFMSKGHDGIIYPTVQGEGTTINVALTAKAADTLKLEYVTQIANLKAKGLTRTFFTKQSAEIINGKILTWTNCTSVSYTHLTLPTTPYV